ncbi:response regulator transcription factor [Adhaeribacter pallidiroseus]|uniref:Chemotaxis response regulator protein-glutamate methylesterase of group 1 operon n=1 Tax=Adhaeribacter pallidiroseus TaxID=2072847 RepID=A0A369QIG8_9BACT|nr:response regulator transcription factor [Adhaeribacter pallidiroseus]RDC64202.1 Chemotaxis response regulator protein-glutamate methylesterase of group 1 operon [Adhaeribacter pallidiroseus]
MPLRIIIFDDNVNIRESITLLLSTVPHFEVVGTFSNVLNCLTNIKKTQPDVILMDIAMPEMTGIEAVKLIKQEFPHIQVLMQTVFEDDERVFDSICSGASGYILKSFLNTNLITAIQELQYGGAPMSPTIARKVLNKLKNENPVQTPEQTDSYHLTIREKEILACLVDGLSYKMIAAKLFISYETVRSHVKNIYEKLHVASLTEVVAKAIKQRIV